MMFPKANKVSVITIDLDDTLWDNKPTLDYAEQTLHNWLKQKSPRIAEVYSISDLESHRREIALENPGISHDLTLLRLESLSQLCKEMGYMEEKAHEAISVFLEARNNVTLYNDVIPFLDKVSRNYKIVALSNGNANVDVIGLGHYFTLTLSPSCVGRSKPEPDMFYHVINQLNIEPDSILHVGDEPETDILGAHRAGVYSVWLNRHGVDFPKHIPLPDMEITSLSQLV